MSAPFRECDRECATSLNMTKLAGDARHYLDCTIWLVIGVDTSSVKIPAQRRAPGLPQITGGDGTGQRAAARTPLPRHGLLYRLRGIGTAATLLAFLALIVFLFGAYVNWWG